MAKRSEYGVGLVVIALGRFNEDLAEIQRRITVVTREGRIAARLTQPAREEIEFAYRRSEAAFARAVREDRVRVSRGLAATSGTQQVVAKLGALESPVESAARAVLRNAADRLMQRGASQIGKSRQILQTLGPEGVERMVAFMNTFERPLAGQSERYKAVLKGAVTQTYAQRTPQGIAATNELLRRANDARLLLPRPDGWSVHHEVGEVFGPAFADRERAARQLALTKRLTVKDATKGLFLSPIKDEPLQWFDESVWLVYRHDRDLIALFTGGLEFKGLSNAAELATQFPTGVERLGLGRVRLSIGDARTLLLPAVIRPKMFGAFPTGGKYATPDLPQMGARLGLPIDPISLGPINNDLWAVSEWLRKEWGKPPAQSLIPVLEPPKR